MISMDGRGRVYDNIFVERLWRSVKYEEVYLKEYDNGKRSGLKPQSLLWILQRGASPSGSRVQDPVPALHRVHVLTRWRTDNYSPSTKVYFSTLRKSIFCLDRGVHLIPHHELFVIFIADDSRLRAIARQ